MQMKNWRTKAILLLVFISAAVIICRLFYIQVINNKFYQSQALGQQTGFKEIQGQRGQVFFDSSEESRGEYGSGEVKSLAIDKDKWLVSAVPELINDKNNFAEALSKIIGDSKESIISKLDSSNSYVIIKKNLPDDQVAALKKINLKGMSLENSPARYYPQETMAS